MEAANKNDYGITHTGYATDMTEAGDLRSQLRKAGKAYQETPLNRGTWFAENARIITYQSDGQATPVSTLIIPMAGADSWCEEYYIMVGVNHEAALSRDWGTIIHRVRELAPPDTRRKAYKVSYATEDQWGNIEPHATGTKYYSTLGPTDDHGEAVAYAKRLTDDAEDNNGTFVSAWYTHPKQFGKRRIIATVTEMLFEDVPDA
jgi:hypothetical protein